MDKEWRGGLVRTNDYNFARELMKVVSKTSKRINSVSLKEVKYDIEDKPGCYSYYYELTWE